MKDKSERLGFSGSYSHDIEKIMIKKSIYTHIKAVFECQIMS